MGIQADPVLVANYMDAKAALKDAEDALSADIMAKSPFKKGDRVRNKYNRYTYEVTGGFGYFSGVRSTAQLQVRRVYSNGRPPARATSYMSQDELEEA